jgi:hypothetical protein
MKQLIRTTVVLAFSLYVAPGMAFDNGGSVKGPVTFAAFRHMSTLERATLTPLTDTELASIEGASLAGLMATQQQTMTIFLAILAAQRGPLGCDASCVAQIMTRLAPAPTGASLAVVQQTSPSNGASPAVVNQTSPSNGTNVAVVNQT